MSRPRKPTAILKLSGAFKANPARAKLRENEPIPRGELGRSYSDLPPEVLACWREIVKQCAPGVLTSADRAFVRYTSRLMAKDNAGDITTGERALLQRAFGDLGMTPRGRAYVKGDGSDPSKPENPFAD